MRLLGGGAKSVRRRMLGPGATLIALGATAVVHPAYGAPLIPPDTTIEVTITSGQVVAPGGTVAFSGTCWVSGFGSTQEAFVRGARRAPEGSGIQPFDFSTTIAVNHSTGAFSGTITVPGDAPNGTYALRSICSTQDQDFGVAQQLFTIEGPLITTTTTTSPLRATPHVDPGVASAAPAAPVRGAARLTG